MKKIKKILQINPLYEVEQVKNSRTYQSFYWIEESAINYANELLKQGEQVRILVHYQTEFEYSEGERYERNNSCALGTN